jgi:hypothetical protein
MARYRQTDEIVKLMETPIFIRTMEKPPYPTAF